MDQNTQEQGTPDRRHEVLSAVLDLMVEEGDRFSMAAVARRASCSKETLYKWFGDRDGLLTATVRWQASKVALPDLPATELTPEALAAALEGFAVNWLKVLTGDISIALNRLAIAHAGSGKSALGRIVLENGPFEMARRLEPVFLAGRRAGIIDFEDIAAAFRAFFGLVVADTQTRALLGEAAHPSPADIGKMARRATAQFLELFSAGPGRPRKTN